VTHNVREAVRLADRTVLFFSSPGRVKKEFSIDFARPRHFEDAGVAQLSGELTSQLKAEVAQHVR
jgi:NitT/TauT family transport system ATP-binding protein